jgi:DNA polymerase III subunit delta'
MSFFKELIGQNLAVELLSQAIIKKRIAPAYLFTGPTGVGRTLAAKCFSEVLICADISASCQVSIQKRVQTGNHPDLLWVQPTYLDRGKYFTVSEAAAEGLKRKASPQIRIEQIREIIQFLSRSPLEASRSIVVIEEAQTMTEAAANALLKTLEEPGQATLILIAPQDSLLPTLVSRCQYIPFFRLSAEDMKRALQKSGYEKILAHPELIAIAQGSPGDAINAFAQLQVIPQDLLTNLTQLPKNPLDLLKLAKEIDKKLDTQTQLWLVDYLQNYYWQSHQAKIIVQQLDKVKEYLLSYVQPRLVWECTLFHIHRTIKPDVLNA